MQDWWYVTSSVILIYTAAFHLIWSKYPGDIGYPQTSRWSMAIMKDPVARLQHVQAPKDWDLVGTSWNQNTEFRLSQLRGAAFDLKPVSLNVH